MIKKFAVALLATAAFAAPSLAGPRVEVHAGWDRANAEGEGASDVMYGVGAGYDLPVGEKFFAGIDANYDDSSTKYCTTASVTTACVAAGRDLSVGGRFGKTIGEHGKLYVLGAYTNAKVTGSVTTGANTTLLGSDKLDGFRLGAGYQRGSALGPYFKVEYRYSNYEQDFSRHQVLGGVGVEF